ncbi:hypothetical protein PHET_02150 [Paragonimus heterotremus]|uniref:Neurexin n=1 Tax=Paragonimus heterotremus TaxID=100268 RepID=A0A8J4SSH8_9TREM|nr:hypothetical protein PHET_02150 [Paragonimus heterotremus]
MFRTGIQLMIEIDGEKHSRSIHLRNSYLSSSGFVIGSTRYSSASNSPVTLFNFVGEIKHFLFNDIDLTSVPRTIMDDATNDVNLLKQTKNQSMNWLIEMDVQLGGTTEPAASYEPAYPFKLTGNTCPATYLRLRPTTSWLPVRFAFRTSVSTSVLFLGMNNDGQQAIFVGLDQGNLKLIHLNAGMPLDSTTFEQRLDDDRWHVVHFSSQGLNQKTVILEVDKMSTHSKRGLLRIHPGMRQWNGFRAYFGRIPMHMFPAWNSLKQTYRNFRGCFGDISFADEPPVDFVHVALQTVNENGSVDSRCASAILPGCVNDSRPSCEASQTNRERGWLTAEAKNHLCRNGGRCVRVGRSFVCDCQETTFRGQHCTLAETTALFGSCQWHNFSDVKVESDNSKLPSVKSEDAGFVHLVYHPFVDNSLWDQFGFGIQMCVPDFPTIESRKMSLLFYTENADDSQYVHVYMVSGQLYMTLSRGVSITELSWPTLKLNDANYHRARALLFPDAVVLELDGKTSYHSINRDYWPLSGSRRKVIWIGHSPFSEEMDFFEGYITGMTFNGLSLLNVAFDITHRAFVRAIRYGRVTLIPNFQVHLKADSSLNSLKYRPENREQKFTSKTNTVPSFFNGSQSYLHMTLRSDENLDLISSSASISPPAKRASIHPSHEVRTKYPLFSNIGQPTNSWLLLGLLFTIATLTVFSLILAFWCWNRKLKKSLKADKEPTLRELTKTAEPDYAQSELPVVHHFETPEKSADFVAAHKPVYQNGNHIAENLKYSFVDSQFTSLRNDGYYTIAYNRVQNKALNHPFFAEYYE